MANHYRQFCVGVRLRGKLAPGWVKETLSARSRERVLLLDSGDDEAADAIGIDFQWHLENGHLYLTDDDDSGNVENVAKFLRELIGLGYVQAPVPIYWADTCSRRLPGEFMGGAALVAKNRTYWFDLPALVERKTRALKRRRCASR